MPPPIKTYSYLEELRKKKYITKSGPASEMELMEFFLMLSTLKILKFTTIASAYEKLVKKLKVAK